MSLRIRSSSGRRVVETGIGFQCDVVVDSGVNSGIYYNDLLLDYFRHGMYARAGVQDISRVFGFDDSDGAPLDYLVQRKPVIVTDTELHNQKSYGSFFQNLQTFGRVLGGGSVLTVPSREHAMRHDTFQGGLVTHQLGSFETWDDYYFYGHPYRSRSTSGLVYHYFYVTGKRPNQGFVYSRSTPAYTMCVDDLLDSLKGQTIVYSHAVGTNQVICTLSDVSYDSFESGLRVTYNLRTDYPVINQEAEWRSTLIVPFWYPTELTDPSIGVGYSAQAAFVTTFSNVGWYRTTGDRVDFSVESSYPGNFCFPTALSNCDDADSSDTRPYAIQAWTDLSAGRFSRRFGEAINSDFTELAPASLFSSVDAFNQLEGYLGTNVLQNLAKLPGFIDSLPKLREAVDVLGKLAKRDLNFATFREILDLASSTHLQASFEWRPWSTILNEYAPKLAATFSALGLQPERIVGYGSFRAELHNVLGRTDVNLTVRTKIVLVGSVPSWLATLTGIDALGLLPKASNLWDLIPFTFLVNWFTGVGAAMRRAESSIILMGLPAYYVHTFAFTSPFSTDELRLLHASSDRTSPPLLRYYMRDVTTITPAPRDTKYGFGIPSGIPFIGTLGSLAYQLIFG